MTHPGWARSQWTVATPWPRWTYCFWRGAPPPQMLLRALERAPGVVVVVAKPDATEGTVKIPDNAQVVPDVAQLLADLGVVRWSRTSPPVQPTPLLRPYQLAAVNTLLDHGGGLLCDEMGLGKSRSAAWAVDLLTPSDRVRLIVGPSYTRSVWRRELAALGLLRGEDDFCALEGLAAGADPHGRWWFCHYEILEAWRARLCVPSRGARFAPYAIIADEIHNCMNPRAIRTKALLAVAAGREVRIGLTGTPVANRPRELWPLLTFMDGPKTWGSWLDFRLRYCSAYQDDWGWKDGEPSNTGELRARMGNRYIRRTKKDVALDLPALRRQGVIVESDGGGALSDAERRAILDVLLARSGHKETLRLIGALRKKSSSAKVRATVERVEALLEDPDERVVVFCHERARCDQLARAVNGDAEGYPRARVVHGAMPLEERDQAVADFQAGLGRVLVATFGTLREGVTLTRAANLVLHDLDWVPATLLQSEARVHRIGQTEPVTVYWMILRDSIDDLFLQALATKSVAIEETVAISDGNDAVDALVASGVDVTVVDHFAEDVRAMGGWWGA